jgi:protein TonB
MIDLRLGICAAASVVVHFAIERGLERLPRHVDQPLPQQISIRVIEPEPPKEPDKLPEPEKQPEPLPAVANVPKARPVHAPLIAAVAKDTPPPDHQAVQTEATTDTPVFGVSMESTSEQGGGPAMPVGNTLAPGVATGSGAPVRPLAAPVAAFEATKLPLPQGRCIGQYTDDARSAGLEGTVVLDLTVDERGHARDIAVVQGLAHGLSDAAKRALLACTFSPGEKDGKPVAVRIRGFKIQFVLQDSR